MMFPCPICKTELPVKKAKSGKHFLRCDDCGVLMFINDEASLALMEAGIEDGSPAPSVQAPGPTPSANAKRVADAVKGEIMPLLKTMDKEIKELKGQVANPKAPRKRKAKATPRKSMTVGEYIRANA